MKHLLLHLACILLPAFAFASSDDGGTESPFAFGTGARELSLAGACLTTADVSSALFWNPARLARAERLTLGGLHSRLYESDVAYQYLGMAIPTIDWGCFGIGVFRLGVDGIEKRDINNFLLGETQDTRLAFYLGYGRTLSNIDFGATATMEHHSIDDYSVTSSPGFNIAAGRTWDFGLSLLEEISAVVTFRNVIQPNMRLVESETTQPLTFSLGGSVKMTPSRDWNHTAVLSVAMTKVEDIDPRFSAGIEYSARDLLHMRGGVRQGRLSFGAGISYRNFGFDYALVDRDMGSLHMFSLTSTFGTPVTEKRQQRALRREQEFNRTMSSRLEERNLQMLTELTNLGKAAVEAGDLLKARDNMDRALFLARNLAADTTEILALTGQIQERLEESLKKQRYRQYVDSAQVKLDVEDFIGARYFASQALAEFDNSPEAAKILNKANTALQNLASHKEMVDSRLWQIDSLLSYGDFDQALTLAKTLAQFAGDDDRIKQALKKAEFEQIRNTASRAYTNGDLQGALTSLDSALVLFPGHNACLDLRKQINRDLAKMSIPMPETPQTSRPPLTAEMKKEVEATYLTAQRLFKAGDLNQAILYWEKVEQLAGDYQSVRKYLINGYKFMGVELYSQNKLKEAVVIWQKAARLNVNNDEIIEYIKRTKNEIRRLEELSYEQQ